MQNNLTNPVLLKTRRCRIIGMFENKYLYQLIYMFLREDWFHFGIMGFDEVRWNRRLSAREYNILQIQFFKAMRDPAWIL